MPRSHAPILLLLASSLLSILGCAKDAEREQSVASGPSVLTVTAAQLIDDYRANEVAADLKYKDKVVTVTGEVDQIKRDLGGRPIVLLKGAAGRVLRVHCVYAKEHVEAVAAYRQGQTLAVKGVVVGKLVTVNLAGCAPAS